MIIMDHYKPSVAVMMVISYNDHQPLINPLITHHQPSVAGHGTTPGPPQTQRTMIHHGQPWGSGRGQLCAGPYMVTRGVKILWFILWQYLTTKDHVIVDLGVTIYTCKVN